jgi:2-methylisocitrate lyase-like PEP mutase family enzyme
MGTYGTRLRNAMRPRKTMAVIGVFDMLSASIAAKHYDSLFLSGFGFAASHYGLPDIGFVAWPDVIAFAQRLRLAFPSHHLIVDIDDGYVDTEVACQVVRALEHVGVSGVVLEDQRRPRRCGHVSGKQILSLDDYLAKLHAVTSARSDLVVVARTDATDQAEMVQRAEAFSATEADIVLVDGIPSIELLHRVAGVTKSLAFNQIAGGRSPSLTLSQLEEIGVTMAIYSTPCLFAAHTAIEHALVELRKSDGQLSRQSISVMDSQDLLKKNLLEQSEGPRGLPLRA